MATVRFELVLEAKKFRRFETLVVATTPLIVEVIIPELAESVFELIMFVEVASPFTILVSVFTAEFREFWFMKLAVVVEITPLVLLVRINELVEVEIERVLFVIILDVATTPLTSVVKMLPVAD